MSAQKILVWDAPVRVFHLLLMLSFAGAWFTAELDGWRLVHISLGYTVAALVLLRLVWGVVGTRYARFSEFVRGPSSVASDLGSLFSKGSSPRVGHGPAGAVAIVLLLALGLLVPLSGWAELYKVLTPWPKEMHEILGTGMGLLVLVHIAGVLLTSWLHRQNLVAAMVTGMKPGEPGQAIHRSWWALAFALLLAVLGFWTLQWRTADQGGVIGPQQVLAAQQGDSELAKDED
ncbi:MAG: cytochrome b/b6 domain-containing protein [Betaproteobacteria bacterium]